MKLVVLGGGAAGLFCAVNAARLNTNLDVTVLEKSGKLLSKVRVSGGGRCNVTHACFDRVEMSKRYPRGGHFVRKAFHQFFTTDTIHWFEERGVALKTEADGRMFPQSDSSQTIIDCLLREAAKYRVEIRMNTDVKGIRHQHDGFLLECAAGEIAADFICVATGGYPKPGMFDWLRNLGHRVAEPVPSLFTFNIPNDPVTALMGLSVEAARVKISGTKLMQEGPLLITHWGLSGPAVLKLSAWGARDLKEKNWQFKISVNWLPQTNEQELIETFKRLRIQLASQKTGNRNPFGLPSRLWEFLLHRSGVNPDLRWAELPSREQHRLTGNLSNCEFDVKGKTTFKEEFVTSGGVILSEIDVNSMMSKLLPGLYFAGEVLDVDGITGGFNFQHAWTSGFIAASHIAAISRRKKS